MFEKSLFYFFGVLVKNSQIQKYLTEAKNALKYSEHTNLYEYFATKDTFSISGSKGVLLETVEKLAEALKEAQQTSVIDLDSVKGDLKFYRRYCEDIDNLLAIAEEKTPLATKLIKKGLPIIDERIKEIIAEIQKNADTLYKQTKGTPIEDLGKEVNRHGQALLQIRDSIGLEKGINYMQITLFAICAKIPEEERGEACELLKKASEELYIEDKVYLINIILGKVSSQIGFQTVLEDLKHEIKVSSPK